MTDQTKIVLARDIQERETVFRLRYRVYVEELERYRSIADHENKIFKEDIDTNSRLYIATDGNEEAVGCMRNTWGGDAPFSDHHIRQYSLKPFLELMDPKAIIIGERFLVTQAYRGSDLLFKLFCTYLNFCNKHRIQLVFGDCEPHLLNLYLSLGFRTYSMENYNSPEAGYLIPLVMLPEDLAYMRTLKSPLVGVLKDFSDDIRLPESVNSLINDGGSVVSQHMVSRQEYWSATLGAIESLDQNRTAPFDNMTPEEVEFCLTKSNRISCQKGDCILKKGNTAKNMFIVLVGVVEVKNDDETIITLTVGDVFGEMAYFLGVARTMDVIASTDDVRILCLSESQIRKTMEKEPRIAAKLLLNISKMLCARLLIQAK